MLIGFVCATLLLCIGILVFILAGSIINSVLRLILITVFGIALIVCACFSVWCVIAFYAFSYNGKRQLSKQIIEGIAGYVSVPKVGIYWMSVAGAAH